MENSGKSGQEIGDADISEKTALNRAGTILAVADLLWIPQAGLIAWPLGLVLSDVTVNSQSSNSELPVLLLTCVAGLVMIALIRVYLQILAQGQAQRAARRIQKKARGDLLFAAITRSPAQSFPPSGAFAAHVTDQVDLLGPYYRNYWPQFMRLKLVPLAIVLVTAWFSWLAALILVISGPVIPVFMALIGARAKTASADQQEELARLSGMLLDRIRGLETLVLFGAVGNSRSEIRDAGERFRLGTMRVLTVAFLSSTVLELFSALGIAFSAVYVGFSLLGDIEIGVWGKSLGYAQGLFILLLAPEFFAPLRSFSAAYHDRAAGLAARQKLSEMLDAIDTPAAAVSVVRTAVEPQMHQDKKWLFEPPGISFGNVTIDLAGRKVFDRFNCRIEPGETLLITGRSGCGKTTLLDLGLGFRMPDSGNVLVDGDDISMVADALRRKVMYLGQAPRLFHGSVKANLLKAMPDPSGVQDADIQSALHLAGAQDLVSRLPRGLATQLGEDGFGLSVGEIRRIALARAAMRKEARILIVDEPTAGLDPDTAADVIEGLKILSKERTCLIATHDPAVLEISGRHLDLDIAKTPVAPENVK